MRISDWSSDVCSSDLSSTPITLSPCTIAQSPKAQLIANPSPLPPRPLLYDGRRDALQPLSLHPPPHSSRVPRLLAGRMAVGRSEEHTSALQSLMRISSAVFCLKKTIKRTHHSSNSPYRIHFYRYTHTT